VSEWTEVEHPQLGTVEVGGLDYMRTVRNPPIALLPAEVGRGATVADRMLSSTPQLTVALRTREDGGVFIVDAVIENVGFLPTASSAHAETLELVAPIRVELSLDEGLALVDGETVQSVGQLDGWGSLQVGPSRHAIYPGLGARGPRALARWIVKGSGGVRVSWSSARAGSGVETLTI